MEKKEERTEQMEFRCGRNGPPKWPMLTSFNSSGAQNANKATLWPISAPHFIKNLRMNVFNE